MSASTASAVSKSSSNSSSGAMNSPFPIAKLSPSEGCSKNLACESSSCVESRQNDKGIAFFFTEKKSMVKTAIIFNSEFNLNEVLKKNDDGIELINYYAQRKKFMPKHRKILVKLIVDHLVSLKYKTGCKKIGDISNQISLVFLNEDKVFYHIYW